MALLLCWFITAAELSSILLTYYVDEDYPAGPGIIEPLPEWSNWRGSESSTLENDVYVWRYALIVVHVRNEWMNDFRNYYSIFTYSHARCPLCLTAQLAVSGFISYRWHWSEIMVPSRWRSVISCLSQKTCVRIFFDFFSLHFGLNDKLNSDVLE